MQKLIIFTLIFIALAINCIGQVPNVTWDFPISKQNDQISPLNPEIIHRINLVILGDGYTQSELGKFRNDAKSLINVFATTEPFVNYLDYFNIFIATLISPESGISHPQAIISDTQCLNVRKDTVNNLFNSTFDYNGIHRLAYLDAAKVEDVLNQIGLGLIYNQAIVLLNDDLEYGGAGGKIATVTSFKGSPYARPSTDIFLHEIGHSLFDLEDEYWDPNRPLEAYNKTQTNNPNTIKWKNWLNISGIGAFRYKYMDSVLGEISTGWFKPTNGNCKMEFLNKEFCPVCREGIILNIHSITKIIYDSKPDNKDYEPDNDFVPSKVVIENTNKLPLKFEVFLNKPFPNTLKYEWRLNGKEIGKQITKMELTESDLVVGENKLTFTVKDTSIFLKLEGREQKLENVCTQAKAWRFSYKSEKMSIDLFNKIVRQNCYAIASNAPCTVSPKCDFNVYSFTKQDNGIYKVKMKSIGYFYDILLTLFYKIEFPDSENIKYELLKIECN